MTSPFARGSIASERLHGVRAVVLVGSAFTFVPACVPSLSTEDSGDEKPDDPSADDHAVPPADPPPPDSSPADPPDPDQPGEDEEFPGPGEECVPGIGDCGPGFKCQPYASRGCYVDGDMCAAIIGDQQLGDPCTRTRYQDDCAKDLFCFAGTSAKEGPGICRQLCDGSDPNSCHEDLGWTARSACAPHNGGTLPMCEQLCHPLADECGEGDGCYYGGRAFYCMPSAVYEGDVTQGQPCYTIQSCQSGLACLSAESVLDCESDYCCTTVCDLNGDDTCPKGSSCQLYPFDPYDDAFEPDPSWLDVGTCSPDADGG